MTQEALLPAGFEALEPYIERWAIATTHDRDRARGASSFEELEDYYRVAKPLLQPALAYLDKFPVKELAGKERRLMEMMLSLAHVSMTVEIHREMEPQHRLSRETMIITRSSTDMG